MAAVVCLDTMLICCCSLNTIIGIINKFGTFCGHCYAVHYYWYWYWVLVSLEANIIGYCILGAFLGVILTVLSGNHSGQVVLVCLLPSSSSIKSSYLHPGADWFVSIAFNNNKILGQFAPHHRACTDRETRTSCTYLLFLTCLISIIYVPVRGGIERCNF